MRRPRLYWCDVELQGHPSYEWREHHSYDELIFAEEAEPIESTPNKGWSWPGGEKDERVRLPTFTRAIPRRKPPPEPAGIEMCSSQTLELWKADQMKFPPYTYLPLYLFVEKGGGRKRVACADERERLMGFPTGYTRALYKKEAEDEAAQRSQEVGRMAAIGNAFHAVVVAILLDLWMMEIGERSDLKGAAEILRHWHHMMQHMSEEGVDDPGCMDLPMIRSISEEEAEEKKSPAGARWFSAKVPQDVRKSPGGARTGASYAAGS